MPDQMLVRVSRFLSPPDVAALETTRNCQQLLRKDVIWQSHFNLRYPGLTNSITANYWHVMRTLQLQADDHLSGRATRCISDDMARKIPGKLLPKTLENRPLHFCMHVVEGNGMTTDGYMRTVVAASKLVTANLEDMLDHAGDLDFDAMLSPIAQKEMSMRRKIFAALDPTMFQFNFAELQNSADRDRIFWSRAQALCKLAQPYRIEFICYDPHDHQIATIGVFCVNVEETEYALCGDYHESCWCPTGVTYSDCAFKSSHPHLDIARLDLGCYYARWTEPGEPPSRMILDPIEDPPCINVQIRLRYDKDHVSRMRKLRWVKLARDATCSK